MKLRINLPLKSHKLGDIVKIKTDDNGIPLDKYWRNRIRDAKIDNCVTIIEK